MENIDNKVVINRLTNIKENYETRILSNAEIEQSIELQSKILKTLKENQTYIHVNSKEDLENKMQIPNFMIGVFVGNKLIAQQVLQKETEISPPNNLGIEKNSIYSLGGVLVNPEYRGNNLMEIMSNHSSDILAKANISGIFAECDMNNHYSYSNLIKAGFYIKDAYIDPEDNGETYRLFKPLKKEITFNKENSEYISSKNLSINKVNEKLKENKYIIGFDKENSRLLIASHLKYLNRDIQKSQQIKSSL